MIHPISIADGHPNPLPAGDNPSESECLPCRALLKKIDEDLEQMEWEEMEREKAVRRRWKMVFAIALGLAVLAAAG